MKSYVVQVNREGRIFDPGFTVEPGWYVLFTNDVQAVVDIGGPWCDEHDALMAQIRAEELAA